MKKLLCILSIVLVVVLSFALVACKENSYSADTIKSNLQSKGYIVSQDYDIVFDAGEATEVRASELPGIQKVFAVTKGTGDNKEVAIILVFDSIKSVENGIPAERLIKLAEEAKYQSGDDVVASIEMGTYNNVCFAGPSACKQAAGLK